MTYLEPSRTFIMLYKALVRPHVEYDVDVDVERKQAQAIASLPDSITHYYAYSNEDITVISLRLPVP